MKVHERVRGAARPGSGPALENFSAIVVAVAFVVPAWLTELAIKKQWRQQRQQQQRGL